MTAWWNRMFAVLTIALACSVGRAEDLANIEEVVGGLDNPSGLAIQPETGMIYVSDSASGKVIRVDPKTKKAEDAIIGFGADIYGKGPMYKIGPLGLTFVDKKTLVVGGGGDKDEAEVVFVFEVPEAGKTKKAEEAKQKLGPLVKMDQIQAEGNYYGLTYNTTVNALFVSCNGDDTKGWVAKAEFKDGKFGEFKRFIATKEATQVDAPVAMATSPKGKVVVGQMGEINVPKDSLLTFYDPKDGKMKLNLKINLFDVTALTYSPKSGRLFATDFAWMDEKEGGIYILDDDDKNSLKNVIVTKVVGLDKPSAAVFAPDGSLYVTVFGQVKEGTKSGKLLKLTGKKEAL